MTDYGEKGHTVLTADFVTTDDGTGVVHTAVAFGEDDFQLGLRYGAEGAEPGAAGRHVRRADRAVRRALRQGGGPRHRRRRSSESGRLFRAERYLHAYPHCWRCDTPLLYYAKQSWYVKTTAVKDELLAANESVNWHPPHIKHGRMGNWLEGNVDWALSRERYWGTPLPVWRCTADAEHVHCVGSRAELAELGAEVARATCTGRSWTTSRSPAPTAAPRCAASRS